MGKIVIPKNSASLEEVMGAMQIYYDANDWVQNSDFIQTYKSRIGIIGDDNDSSAYTKKTEIGAYYGFLEWEDINRTQSPRRITSRGKEFLEHYNANDMEAVHEDIMNALEEVTFGRNNFACRSCDSDIEPPALFLRALLQLGYLSNTEFAYLVYKMEYEGKHYTETLQEIESLRSNEQKIDLPDEARKFSDPKPILMLERWGVLVSQQDGGKKTKISSSFFEKYKSRIQNLKIYNIDKNVGNNTELKEMKGVKQMKFESNLNCDIPRNRILFGAPGTGKSHTLNEETEQLIKDMNGEYERVTFHPDYSYANFVGTYKPVPSADGITYKYVPGPFMRVLKKALENTNNPDETPKPFILVIEEINRANVAAVFGDVFQLLDRNSKNISDYSIQASEDLKNHLAEVLGGNPENYAELRIPSNMFIWATMNSADQGVFPMDTAFKRRWDFKYLGIDNGDEHIAGKAVTLGKGDYKRTVEWNNLRKAINNVLSSKDFKINEDKLMGPYFLSTKIIPLEGEIDEKKFIDAFKSKVIMYLFEDAAKQKKHSLFSGCSDTTRYSSIRDEFDTKGVFIFCEEIHNKFPASVSGEDETE